MASNLEQEFARALDELLMEAAPDVLQGDDLTVMRVSKRGNITRQRARKLLEEWRGAGRVVYLGKRREPRRGAMVDAWRMVKKKPA